MNENKIWFFFYLIYFTVTHILTRWYLDKKFPENHEENEK